jgi:hypothetical protein
MKTARNILSHPTLDGAGQLLHNPYCPGIGDWNPAASARLGSPEAGGAEVEMQCIETPLRHRSLPY